jgi:uncharacterized protein YabE (DUF348 family)
MRDLITNKSVFRFLLACLLIGMTLFAVAVVPSAYAAGEGEHLIMIHDRGEDTGIITKARTLRDAFDEANIKLDKNDIVEPGLDEDLVTNNYQVNVYRARPILIVDGNVKQLVMSAYQTPKQIAGHAGIDLQDEDRAEIDVNNNFVSDGASLKMTIDRATQFTFVQYGKRIETARTQAATVGGMLKEKGVTLGPNDGISLPNSTPITPGMTISVWRNGKQTITQDEPIVKSVEEVKDTARELGFREVKTAGQDGSKSVTYEIEMRDGIEVSRTAIASVTLKEPVKETIIIGAKLPVPTNPSENAQLGHQMMLAYGFGEDQWSCLYNLWMRESGWRVNAANPSGAYGIPQALPGSKMGAGWQTDAAVQIQWGLGYVKGRYGTPCGAWSSFQAKGWY